MSQSRKDCSNILRILRRFGLFYQSYYAGLRKKPDIRMQTSLMTSEESRYADILIARGAQRKHLAKETEILQTASARLGRSDGEIEIGKSILPKGSTLRDLPVYFDLEDN